MKILILGAGGREHSVGKKLAEEGHEIYAAPGNPGIAQIGRCVTELDVKDHKAVIDYVKSNGIGFTFVGPEAPLDAGIVDDFERFGLPIFGPTKMAAQIETSKEFCCTLLEAANVPIPATLYYNNFAAMEQSVAGSSGGIVLKKSGLAAGKGAEVVRNSTDLIPALTRLKKLGDGSFLVQTMEEGPELSYFVLTDGTDFVFLGSAQDYKPLYPGGPNTGGMGGFAPHPILTSELQKTIDETVVRPTIKALAEVSRPYKGVLYIQLMITKRGPVVIEINCRFGDPEAQLIMPLLNCELLPLLQATTKSGFLRMMEAKFKPWVSVGIVMASEGYPDDPKTGRFITGLDREPGPNDPNHYAYVYHAGTKMVEDQLVTSGGRVLTVVGTDSEYEMAKNMAMMAVSLIWFEGEQYRPDVGNEAIAAQAAT
ncbi:MAG: phosphoribosylamine--glycine ligase [Candidatus Doudnabacteria bacterium]